MTGRMLPQPEISIEQDEKMLLDNALGSGFALLCLHENAQKAFASLKSDIWQCLDTRFVAIHNEVKHFPLHDSHLFVLVRPDRYVLGVFKEGQEEAFVARLRRHLEHPRHS